MTELDYTRKRNLYATSDAPDTVIAEAIKALDAEWQTQSTEERREALSNALVEGGEIDDID